MPDNLDNKNEALSRIAPKRKNVEEPVNVYAKKKLPESEGISIPKAPRAKPKVEASLDLAPKLTDKKESEPEISTSYEQDHILPDKKEDAYGDSNASEHKESSSDEYEEDNDDDLDEIIKDVKYSKPKRYKKVRLYILILCLVLIIGFCLYYFLLRTQPSAYSKLNNVNYNQNSISFSYKYPAILSRTGALTTKNPDILSAYDAVVGPDNILVDVSALPDAKVLSSLKLTPSDLLSQLRSGHGSYIAYLDQLYPNNYKNLFGSCLSDMVTLSNQTVVVCTDNTDGYNSIRLVGVDKNYLYIFQLYMSSPVWNNNQNIWTEVEKSFNW